MAWYWAYPEKMKMPPGIALLTGGATHKGAEVNFLQKIETHADLPEKDIVEAAVEELKLQFKGEVHLDDFEKKIGKRKVKARTIDKVAALASLHAREQAPDYQPVAVEKKFHAALNDEWDIVGYADVITEDMIADFKTAGKSKRQSDADMSEQLTTYYACEPKANLRLDVLVKTKTPKRQILDTTRTPADVRRLELRYAAMIASVETGVFVPCDPSSWKCTRRFCGYVNICPYFSGRD
jgi:hypothetical protein